MLPESNKQCYCLPLSLIIVAVESRFGEKERERQIMRDGIQPVNMTEPFSLSYTENNL